MEIGNVNNDVVSVRPHSTPDCNQPTSRMVTIQNQNRRVPSSVSFEIHRRFRNLRRLIVCAITGLFFFWMLMVLKLLQQSGEDLPTRISPSLSAPKTGDLNKDDTTIINNTTYRLTCPSSKISILDDLTDEQRNPTIGKRWMVRPPFGGNLHLMCCDTTKGPFHVLLHEQWAPIGVPHLLGMLEGGYFDTDIPLFRCTDACQFGLSSDPKLTKKFAKSISDDPLWLPTGPDHQFSSSGVNTNGTTTVEKIKRYPKGVWTHAGSGTNSRGTQFVLTLKPNKFMGGGSPWEVPLGEVMEVGGGEKGPPSNQNRNHNHNEKEDPKFVADVSLPDIYTGYGGKGPGQGLLRRVGASESVRKDYPLLDYVLRCSIVDRFLEAEGD